MPWFLQEMRASRCRRAFSVAGEQRPRGFSTDVAERTHSRAYVLHERRMYARKVKACRSTRPERERERERERPSLRSVSTRDVSPETFAAAARTRDGATSRVAYSQIDYASSEKPLNSGKRFTDEILNEHVLFGVCYFVQFRRGFVHSTPDRLRINFHV